MKQQKQSKKNGCAKHGRALRSPSGQKQAARTARHLAERRLKHEMFLAECDAKRRAKRKYRLDTDPVRSHFTVCVPLDECPDHARSFVTRDLAVRYVEHIAKGVLVS